jgi:hypothetical protein
LKGELQNPAEKAGACIYVPDDNANTSQRNRKFEEIGEK